jgi:predicted transcriptional regulator
MTTLHIARRRSTILDYLRDGPFDKRALLDRVDASRSTVDRAIEELLDSGLVRAVDGGYETTLAGVLALERARAIDRDADAIERAEPALAPLWKESNVDVPFLRGADVSLVGEDAGVHLLKAFGAALRNADEIRGVFPQITRPSKLETFLARVEAGAEVDLVVSESLFGTLATTFPGWLQDVVDCGGRISLGSVPEYALVVCGAGDDREAFLPTYDDGRLHGVIRNDGDAAAWADDRIAVIRAGATEQHDRIQQLAASAEFGGVDGATPPFGEVSAVAQGATNVGEEDALLASGYAIDDGKLRTPAVGTEKSATVAFWMRPTDLDGGWQILLKWDYVAIALRRGELHGMVYDPDDEQQRAYTAIPLDDLADGCWQHVAYTYDESRARLYLDGVLVDETEDDYPLGIDEIGAALGYHYHERDTGVHEPTYEGRLYDARLYGAALSPEAIDRLVTTTDPTSVAWEAE